MRMVKYASMMLDQKLAKMFIDNQSFIQDGEVDDEELKFMENPNDQNQISLRHHYLDKIKRINPDFGAKLEKLYDFINNDMGFLPAIESQIEVVNKGMLDIGYLKIPVGEMSRTSSENSLWLTFDNPLAVYKKTGWFPDYIKYGFPFNKNKAAELADVTWWVASTSNGPDSVSSRYGSERWKNLNEVAARLISPELVEVSTRYIFPAEKQDINPLKDEKWIPPQELLSKRVGNAADIAAYQATVLERNGYEAYILFYGSSKDAMCLYKDGNKFRLVTMRGILVSGSFDTTLDAAKAACDADYIPFDGFYHVRTTDGKLVSK